MIQVVLLRKSFFFFLDKFKMMTFLPNCIFIKGLYQHVWTLIKLSNSNVLKMFKKMNKIKIFIFFQGIYTIIY